VKEAAMDEVVLRPLGVPGDLGWILMAHGELYAAEYGWAVEEVTAPIVAGIASGLGAGEAGWIAERDGRRVGSVLCLRIDAATAQLRLLLVDPAARGLGLGRRLVRTCVGFARDAGYQRLELWTNEPLAAARRLYLDAGFALLDEESHRHFGPELHGQRYTLDLAASPPGPDAEAGVHARSTSGLR
jgi:GNAT superfamily N-acetyltransferase